jgi:hypothetical protein
VDTIRSRGFIMSTPDKVSPTQRISGTLLNAMTQVDSEHADEFNYWYKEIA